MAALRLRAIVHLQHMPHVYGNSETKTCGIRPMAGFTGKNIMRFEMAYVNTTRAASASFAERFGNFFAGLKATAAQHRVYNQTVHDLRQLSDRDLEDLGIHRLMIKSVAHEAAYGK